MEEEHDMSFEIDKENMNSEMILRQAAEIMDAEPWYVAAMSNLSALIMASMDRLNWAGFYLIRGNELVVGPFQGKPACIRIPVGKGVCGTAIAQDKIQVVHNAVNRDESQHQYHLSVPPHKETRALFMVRITYQKGPDYFAEASPSPV